MIWAEPTELLKNHGSAADDSGYRKTAKAQVPTHVGMRKQVVADDALLPAGTALKHRFHTLSQTERRNGGSSAGLAPGIAKLHLAPQLITALPCPGLPSGPANLRGTLFHCRNTSCRALTKLARRPNTWLQVLLGKVPAA